MDLVDTNIFLEIILQQSKAADCETYLRSHAGQYCFSSFTFHSIGVLLFKKKQVAAFEQFMKDFLPIVFVKALSPNGYMQLPAIQTKFNLDFDDCFQYAVAEENQFQLVTMDADFEKVGNSIPVLFL